MSFHTCNGRCKEIKIRFNPSKKSYEDGYVRCVTCGIKFSKEHCVIKGMYNKQYCPCCGGQVRSKPRHHTRNNRVGIDTRVRIST